MQKKKSSVIKNYILDPEAVTISSDIRDKNKKSYQTNPIGYIRLSIEEKSMRKN